MGDYVVVQNGAANRIVVSDEDIQGLIETGLHIIDVTQMDPQPKTGWRYNEATGEFSNPATPQKTNLYIHLEMTDGDGREPLGIINNGVDHLGIVATFRASPDPASPVITAITGMSWRVTIRNEQKQIYDIVDVAFVDGIASFAYTTTGKPDVCSILESDFEPLEMGGTTYIFKLVGNSQFKVFRSL